MAYMLEAVLTNSDLLRDAPSWLADSKVVLLDQNVSMIPVTDELHDRLLGEGSTPEPLAAYLLFARLSVPLAEHCRELSEHGLVAYVEAEYFGGIGEQRAIAWRHRQVVLEPREQDGAINQVLRLLDVDKGHHLDEFDAVDLGRHRHTSDWLELDEDEVDA